MKTSEKLWQQALLSSSSTIAEAIQNLNKTGVRIILVTNKFGVLEGTISDGDVRRGLLKGLDVNSSIKHIIYHNPLVVPVELSRELVMQLMAANKIQQIPIVDKSNRVVGLHLWNELASTSKRENIMVIMAGGMGKRMRPYTEDCPKPLLQVSGKPMLQHIIERAKLEGFSQFLIAIHYLGHMIEDYFGDGERLGVEIAYLKENAPLGTAGALSLLNPKPGLPFVVTNGDVITDIRYGELLDFHVRHAAAATMAVSLHEWQHPYGVVHTDGVEIIAFEEKPVARSHINAGVYVLNPDVLSFLNDNERCDMPELFGRLQVKKNRTIAYPMHEPWLDVGLPEDLIHVNKI